MGAKTTSGNAQWGVLLTVGLLVTGLLPACGGQAITTRMVNDPTGEGIEYGAPQATTYKAELDAGQQYGRITIYKSSRCHVIPVTVMQRYRETLRGEKVIERNPVTKVQVAGDPQGDVPCEQTYARNVEVFLQVGDGRFS